MKVKEQKETNETDESDEHQEPMMTIYKCNLCGKKDMTYGKPRNGLLNQNDGGIAKWYGAVLIRYDSASKTRSFVGPTPTTTTTNNEPVSRSG